MEIGPVTAETVEGFELLYATPGTGDIAEIAGHLLLRIRMKQEIPDPNRDLVISFLAATPETEFSLPPSTEAPECRSRNWFNLIRPPGVNTAEAPLISLWQSIKGLTGGFPVVMDVQTLAITQKTYTVEQDRTLRRYRLLLSKEEKAGLLARLVRYPEEELPRYYFFPQNCGSVLVRVIGEGIGSETIAGFSPSISPPHSLVGLLIREGRAEPVHPDMYSFRDQGRLARISVEETWSVLHPQLDQLPAPSLPDLLHRNARVRLDAVQNLRSLSAEQPELDAHVYLLASLLQETETVFDPKDRYCRDATGPVTAELRRWQQDMLVRNGEGIVRPLPPLPPAPLRSGTPHTRLYPLKLTGTYREVDHEEATAGIAFGIGALREEMGSRSQVAMQRAGAVDLFTLDLEADHRGIQEVEWTGLDLRKFREGLGDVETGPWNNRAWGIGLRVLEGSWQEPGGAVSGTLAGMSALLNLASSSMYDTHLFLTAGVDAGHRDSDWGLRMPLTLHGLLTVGEAQARMTATWSRSWVHDEEDFWKVKLRLSIPLASRKGTEWIGVLQVETEENQSERVDTLQVGLEVLRF